MPQPLVTQSVDYLAVLNNKFSRAIDLVAPITRETTILAEALDPVAQRLQQLDVTFESGIRRRAFVNIAITVCSRFARNVTLSASSLDAVFSEIAQAMDADFNTIQEHLGAAAASTLPAARTAIRAYTGVHQSIEGLRNGMMPESQIVRLEQAVETVLRAFRRIEALLLRLTANAL